MEGYGAFAFNHMFGLLLFFDLYRRGHRCRCSLLLFLDRRLLLLMAGNRVLPRGGGRGRLGKVLCVLGVHCRCAAALNLDRKGALSLGFEDLCYLPSL